MRSAQAAKRSVPALEFLEPGSGKERDTAARSHIRNYQEIQTTTVQAGRVLSRNQNTLSTSYEKAVVSYQNIAALSMFLYRRRHRQLHQHRQRYWRRKRLIRIVNGIISITNGTESRRIDQRGKFQRPTMRKGPFAHALTSMPVVSYATSHPDFAAACLWHRLVGASGPKFQAIGSYPKGPRCRMGTAFRLAATLVS